MKVEFCRNESDDSVLIIKASEFFKAKNNALEFESLNKAINGYCCEFCFEGEISQEEYSDIVKLAKNGDSIIFCANDVGHYNFVLDIYLKRNGYLLKIISEY